MPGLRVCGAAVGRDPPASPGPPELASSRNHEEIYNPSPSEKGVADTNTNQWLITELLPVHSHRLSKLGGMVFLQTQGETQKAICQ